MYDVIFLDGAVQLSSANWIAEGIVDLADEDGYQDQLLGDISDYRKNDNALDKSHGDVKTKSRQKKYKVPLKG